VEVDLQEPNLYTLAISYTVAKALWKPSYDIHITAGEQPPRMEVRIILKHPCPRLTVLKTMVEVIIIFHIDN
jgi:hypothetical protein